MREKEGIFGVGQNAEAFVTMVCRIAFTQIIVGSHQRENNHFPEWWRFCEGDSPQPFSISLMTGSLYLFQTQADNMDKLLGFSQTDFLFSSLLMNAKSIYADLCQQDMMVWFYKEKQIIHIRDRKSLQQCNLHSAEHSKMVFVSWT